MKDKQVLTVEFAGDFEQIDLYSFTGALVSYASILQEASKQINPSTNIKIGINAVRPGCISVDLNCAISLLDTLLKGSIPILPSVVELVTSYMSFKKSLSKHGEINNVKPGNDSHDVIITTQDHSVLTVNQNTYNFYCNNQEANKAHDSMFKALNNDKAIESLNISHENKNLFSAKREDFESLANSPKPRLKNTSDEDANNESIMHNLVLHPISGSYEGASKGYRFKAGSGDDEITYKNVQIEDEDLLSALESGTIRPNVNDTFIVDFKTVQHIKQDGQASLTYSIIKLIEYKKYEPSSQLMMDFTES